MKTKIIIFVWMICLIPYSNAFSQDRVIEGEIAATGMYIGVTGEGGGKSKFMNIETSKNMVVFMQEEGLILIRPNYFLRFDMQDPGYDTQYYNREGVVPG